MAVRSSAPGFHLGRIAGIDVRADPSWLFALFLVVTSLGAGFARFQSGWGPFTALIVAVVGALLFFLSVLLHELAHAIVARALGIPVHGITLFLFGGISNLEREPDSPRNEFFTAIVGPLASFALSVLFFATAVAVGGRSNLTAAISNPERSLDPITAVLLWLAPVNLALGVFNLVPGFPLDGGRVLRALLWRITGNLQRATQIAGGIGQGVGWAFVVLGAAMAFGFRVPWLGRGLFGGLWLAAIGWFLRNAAFASVRDLEIRMRLQGLTVQQLMRHPPPAVPANATVAMLREHWLYTSGATVFPVAWTDRFVGWIERERVSAIAPPEQEQTIVGNVMTPASEIPMLRPTDPATDVLAAFARVRKPVLPVVQDGQLVGWLLLEDVVRQVVREEHVPKLAPLWEHGMSEGTPGDVRP